MAHIDYFVATVEIDDRVQALAPVWNRITRHGVRRMVNGFIGDGVPGAFIGERASDNRMMFQFTGYSSERYVSMIPPDVLERCSIARLDVQRTVAVDKSPDEIISKVVPSSRYRSTVVREVNAEGMTLYIGSPSSRCRLRVYNKTAESGLVAPDGRNLLRVEVQTRDRYADQAFAQVRAGNADLLIDGVILKMVDHKRSARAALDVISNGTAQVPQEWLIRDEPDEVDRRKYWIETCVMPAIRKVLAADPAYREVLTKLIDGVMIGSGTEQHVTGDDA